LDTYYFIQKLNRQ